MKKAMIKKALRKLRFGEYRLFLELLKEGLVERLMDDQFRPGGSPFDGENPKISNITDLYANHELGSSVNMLDVVILGYGNDVNSQRQRQHRCCGAL